MGHDQRRECAQRRADSKAEQDLGQRRTGMRQKQAAVPG